MNWKPLVAAILIGAGLAILAFTAIAPVVAHIAIHVKTVVP